MKLKNIYIQNDQKKKRIAIKWTRMNIEEKKTNERMDNFILKGWIEKKNQIHKIIKRRNH